MEASALQAPVGLARSRISVAAPLFRLRSDEQLVALFRAGEDEAFRVIHDRYHKRLFAYTRQMLPGSRHDAEDALQDVFVRAYAGLRANDRQLALRAWLYRVAHNRCIDELRRPLPPAPEVMELVRSPIHDPIAQAEQRESLRRLIADVRRLPEHQRSALLMRELGGMPYADLAGALGVSVPAVKSLLVRARVGLAQSLEARETACSEIRDVLTLAHDRGVRPNGTARRHMRDCSGCRQFRSEVRGTSRQFAAIVPALGPFGVLANLLGLGGAGSGAAAGGGAVAAGGAAGTGGATAAGGVLATGASHVATLLAAAVVTAGGAVEIQHTMSVSPVHRSHHHVAVGPASADVGSAGSAAITAGGSTAGPAPAAPVATAPPGGASSNATTPARARGGAAGTGTRSQIGSGANRSTSTTGADGALSVPGSASGGSRASAGAGAATGTGSANGTGTAGTGSSTTGASPGTTSGSPGTRSGGSQSGAGTTTQAGTGGSPTGSPSTTPGPVPGGPGSGAKAGSGSAGTGA